MHKEIDILIKAAEKCCAVVEKASHLLWTLEERVEARETGRFQETDRILSPDGRLEVTGLYPGCLQQGGGASTGYRAIGQTEHFVIFAPSDVEAFR